MCAQHRPPRGGPLTPASLEAAALDYLARFSSSREGLRRVLLRRVARAEENGRLGPGAGARLVEAVMAHAAAAGLLDDAAYAASQIASLRRRGTSAQGIRARLALKGVAPELIKQALAAHQEAGNGELAAACALVRRRRLGPLRPPAARERHFLRDLGALARAGFALDMARRVLACGGEAALDALAREDQAAGGGAR